MHVYQAYGLNIRSQMPLPELTEAAELEVQANAVRVRIEPLTASATDTAAEVIWKQDENVYLSWPELGTFCVRYGKEILVDPAHEVDLAQLRPPILGICMAVLLHQRGLLVMHASASIIDSGAVAFLGDKGWGKSTMNAALRKRGRPFLTDDILAIDLRAKPPIVYPAFPQMKLWPSAVSALGDDPQSLPKLLPHLEKRQHLFEENLDHQPVRLKALYVLGKGSELAITPLPNREILSHLFQHSYSGRCGKALLQHGESAHFLQCMQLAQQTPVYRLQRPSDLGLLAAIAQAVEEHVSNID